ncbi:hypothetical protein DWW47_03320 [Odoribacter splanchnicus]|nr:MAG: hypothetical protein BHV82_09470 [Odoribacter sp. 43_10]RGU78625.1 hypothetical protein DWW47_03320 [Odoribacter splanchnicus]HCG21557.1 hypothetical protein [Odoribacter splanchnicus]HCL19899.1 hypothetical protein [Odoribacter splanchnicus]HCU26426.1 hypothetical protein [Odoribacter splanchnicus]
MFVFGDPVASVGRLAFSFTDRRNSSLRSSVKELLTGPFQTNRSDGIKPGIGIERKKLNLRL